MKEQITVTVACEFEIEYSDKPGARLEAIGYALRQLPNSLVGSSSLGDYAITKTGQQGIELIEDSPETIWPRIDRITKQMMGIVKLEPLFRWVTDFNESFQCRPIDMIGTPREQELLAAINAMEEGRPG